MEYTLNDGSSNPGKKGFCGNSQRKLPVIDWLADLPETQLKSDLVEVQFKNTRKGFFLNNMKLPLEKGDVVAVESTPGHDIGTITLTGDLVLNQMKKNNIALDHYEVKRVYRTARPTDIEKYEEAKAKEHDTMIRSRKIAENLQLEMKIGDVEYQGDGSKAIFYYIADGRVDFRQLIKVLAETFRVRIEMKQIGARQEAGRIGGIGPCGRELCCATFMSNFASVSTTAARYQDISTNPLKLAGQCAKIKCCINYEVDTYLDAKRDFPRQDIPLETKVSLFYHFKTDVFKREMTYSSSKTFAANLVTLSVDRVKEILALNAKGERVDTLIAYESAAKNAPAVDFQNVVGKDSLTRFDKSKKNIPNRNNRNRNNRPKNNNQPKTDTN